MTVPRCGPLPRLAAFLVLLLPAFASGQAPPPAAPPGCGTPVARLVSLQGAINLRRAGGATLRPAALNESYCPGDVLELGASSRAAIQLPDQTVVSLDQGTVVTFAAPQDDKRTWLDVLKGALHIIARDPRALRVVTPFANAGIEGTEFLVQVSADSAAVLVFEGRVKVENATGAATAASGQRVVARAGAVPVLEQVVRPRDQVLWTLYYPPTGAGADPRVARAEEQLAVGRVAEAEAELAGALRESPGNAEVLARQSVIALTRNDAARAATLADQAVSSAPTSVAARLAQSYVRQSAGDLPEAVATLEEAAKAEPGNALVQARLAELYLASGDVSRSEATATAAGAADPTLGLARTILGFARLARIDLPGATTAFDEATRLEPWAPLPRLGRGLALIRGGDLTAGRSEIETAVILDPNNSLVRSYMGKAYYEEKRDKLAASQLEIAKELDPNDPTPWFYDAIRKQSVNDPVGALADLRRSAERNDSRAVYRSNLLLDDDSASRNASVSAVYDDLGFESLAVVEATEALADNFGNSSAHRLLANAYGQLPRYDIVRVSEAFQAQLRQPLSALPVNVLDSQDRLSVVRSAGPASPGVNEYNSLFARDQLRLDAEVTVGSRDTSSDMVTVSGLSGRLGYAATQLHYETDGFADNNAGERDLYAGLLQYELTPADSIQVDLRHSEFGLGYTFTPFDPDLVFPVGIDEKSNVARLNGRHVTSPEGDWIWTVGYEDRKRDVIATGFDILVANVDAGSWIGEVQRTDRMGPVQLVSGAGYVVKDEDYPVEEGYIDTDNANAYVYGQWATSVPGLRLIGGVAYDVFKADYNYFTNSIKRSQLSPKAGIVWSIANGTTIRAAAFSSVRRPFIASQTVEPTQVAGFNQFFTGLEQFYGDPEGTISRRIAGALERQFTASTFAGIEAATRRLEVPAIVTDKDYSWREKSARGYFYQTWPGEAWGGLSAALSVAAEYEDLTRPNGLTGSEGILALDSVRVPLGISLFSPRGITVRLGTTFIRQDGDFSADIGFPVFSGKDDGWITDVAVDFRLPKRLGILSLVARNVFDNEIELVDIDPLNPRDATRRIVTGSFRLTF